MQRWPVECGLTEKGWFYHPEFFAEENGYDGSNMGALLDKFNLETNALYLGDGYPRSVEVPLRSEYDEAGSDEARIAVLQKWDPKSSSLPGFGWFLLYTMGTEEDGPLACFARVKD